MFTNFVEDDMFTSADFVKVGTWYELRVWYPLRASQRVFAGAGRW